MGGADVDVFNDATQVVLMREKSTTILSMQNRYQGPLENFAMVVPVPQVLGEENVKTLNKAIFDKIDTLTSPRLVEYQERDPCYAFPVMPVTPPAPEPAPEPAADDAVTIEAEFKVGEYEIVILSTTESTALANWLDANNYSVPSDAAPYYEPYIQNNMYFFVARVDPNEVVYQDGIAILSPLRFHYTSQDFMLPTRLGMINSSGKQDLIVYLLGQNQRYEVANYNNITIPTNIDVPQSTRDDFGAYYRRLFSQTLAENPGAAVTEYAWGVSDCDPCPGPPDIVLSREDIATLGHDILGPLDWYTYRSYIVSRIHLQYAKDEIGEDLVFKTASGITGGREFYGNGVLEQGATPQTNNYNAFQARYIIRNPWVEPVTCEDPIYGRWGRPVGNPNLSLAIPSPSPNTLMAKQVFGDGPDESEPEPEPEPGNLALKGDAGGSSKAWKSRYRNVIDGDPSTYWSPRRRRGERISVKRVRSPFNTVIIRELNDATRAWRLINHDNGEILASGTTLGSKTVITGFKTQSMRKISLMIDRAHHRPRIAEFEIYNISE
ncbi:MAG: DUF2330 domain-containing protein [Myxococcales bacterium]|nr:DUF2330 domain-containing protein [Myxococcales bacterium]